MDGTPRIPAWVDGLEVDDPVVVGHLGPTHERGPLAFVLAVAAVLVRRVVARRVGVPDLHRRAGNRPAVLVDDAQADAHGVTGIPLGDVAAVELFERRERASGGAREENARPERLEVLRSERKGVSRRRGGVGDIGVGVGLDVTRRGRRAGCCRRGGVSIVAAGNGDDRDTRGREKRRRLIEEIARR